MITIKREILLKLKPKDFRELARADQCIDTVKVCEGYVQTNLVILPKLFADDFLLFCKKNPQPCPLIDVSSPGNPHPIKYSKSVDLRTDLPKYRVFVNGKIIDEPLNIIKYWRDDLVSFLLGCSRGIMWAFKSANVPWRRYGAYRTNIQCNPSNFFKGPMVVTPRAFSVHNAIKAINISKRHPLAHGLPIYMGDPKMIGITSLGKPDEFNPYRPVTNPPEEKEIVLYWGCGVTPQAVAVECKIPFMITHCPTFMLVMDETIEELSLL